MVRDKADKQKKKAKEMLGISDDRASEIFEQQPDRKQQRKKELEEKGKLQTGEKEPQQEPETGKEEEVELHPCPECGDEFDSEQGMKVHKGQKH